MSARKVRVPKELVTLQRLALSQGWEIEHRGAHLCWRSPDRSVPLQFTSCTPGGGNRSIENTRRMLVRAGLSV